MDRDEQNKLIGELLSADCQSTWTGPEGLMTKAAMEISRLKSEVELLKLDKKSETA